MPAQGIKPQSIFHQAEEPLKALAQIGRANGQVDPSRRSKSKHQLKSFQDFDGPAQLHRVKAPAQLFVDPWPKSLLIRSDPAPFRLGLTPRHRSVLLPSGL